MFKTMLIDPNTGQVYKSNGTLFSDDLVNKYRFCEFRTLERAQMFGRGVVRRYPYLECVVQDEAGQEIWRHHDAEWLERATRQRQTFQSIFAKQEKRDNLKFFLAIGLSSLFTAALSMFLMKQGIRSELVLLIAVMVSLFVWSVIVYRH